MTFQGGSINPFRGKTPVRALASRLCQSQVFGYTACTSAGRDAVDVVVGVAPAGTQTNPGDCEGPRMLQKPMSAIANGCILPLSTALPDSALAVRHRRMLCWRRG
jgi:hypothetical protein